MSYICVSVYVYIGIVWTDTLLLECGGQRITRRSQLYLYHVDAGN